MQSSMGSVVVVIVVGGTIGGGGINGRLGWKREDWLDKGWGGRWWSRYSRDGKTCQELMQKIKGVVLFLLDLDGNV